AANARAVLVGQVWPYSLRRGPPVRVEGWEMFEQLFVFPPFRLDPTNERLWSGTRLLPLRPKTVAVLCYLVDLPCLLVSGDELGQPAWPDTCGGERAPKQCIRELRKVLGDSIQAPRFIETVARRGYRFIGALQRQEMPLERAPIGPFAATSRL